MIVSVAITSTGGQLVIQDPHPTEGRLSWTVPASGTLTNTCSWDQWYRINTQVDALRAAGLCTVVLTEVTSTGTDDTSGANTTYNKSDWAPLNSFRKDITALQTTVGTITRPFLYKGGITLNTDFPLIALVQTGWFYTILADISDNAGSTYTNTGVAFLAGDEIVWSGTAWIKQGPALTAPFQFKGNIALASDFPPPAATATTGVKDGYVYRCTAGVTDNDATKTNTAQVFLLGDTIVWRTSAWYVISRGAATATPAAIGSAAAGTSLLASNQDHVHAHGNQLGGTLHADVVAGVSSGFMSAAQATTLAAIVDDHIYAKASAVNIITDESEKTGVLTGDVAKHFVPTHLVIQVATVTGTPATPGAINVGTAADGAQIAAGIALTGLILVGDTRIVPISAQTQHLAGNATLYVNVETAEATATVMTCDVWVRGIQV